MHQGEPTENVRLGIQFTSKEGDASTFRPKISREREQIVVKETAARRARRSEYHEYYSEKESVYRWVAVPYGPEDPRKKRKRTNRINITQVHINSTSARRRSNPSVFVNTEGAAA